MRRIAQQMPRALLLGLLLMTVGCESTVIKQLDCSCCLGNEEDVPTTPDTIVPDVTESDGAVAPEPLVGQPCEVDEDCESGFCLCNAWLQGMGLESDVIDIVNGTCSVFGCADDNACGPGGICFNTQPFTGLPISICLLGCDVMADCRWPENYQCYEAPKEPDNPEAGTLTACLPDSLVVAIECDDGHCEGLTQTDGTCSELAQCHWQDGYMCHWFDAEAEQGVCIPDQTVVALECENADCPAMPAPEEEE